MFLCHIAENGNGFCVICDMFLCDIAEKQRWRLLVNGVPVLITEDIWRRIHQKCVVEKFVVTHQ